MDATESPLMVAAPRAPALPALRPPRPGDVDDSDALHAALVEGWGDPPWDRVRGAALALGLEG